MNNRSSTREKVYQVADELLAQGIRPTQQNVRDQLGSGSLTTINSALNGWWQSLSERLTRRNSHPELPDAVLGAANKLWDEALANAEFRYQQRLNEASDAVAAQRQADADEIKQLKQQLSVQQNQHHELMQRYDQAIEEGAQYQRQLLQTETALVKADAKCADLSRQLKQEQWVQANQQMPTSDTDAMFDLKVDLQVKDNKIKYLEDLLDKKSKENGELVAALKSAELDAIKQQHRLELVIAQQDARYEDAQAALADCKKALSLAKSKA